MDQETRVRVKFVTKDESSRVTEAPLAVPTQLGRKGLSEVISHMLGGESQSFDFSIENQLLRCPLEKFFRITGLNTEATVTVEYFRSRSPPNPHHTSAKAESWVSSLAWVSEDLVLGGCYDGSLRRYRPSDCHAFEPLTSHDGPIKALAVANGYVASGGKDRVVRGWAPGSSASSEGGKRKKAEGPILRCVAHLTGHDASVESVAARPSDGMLLSGDWSGMMCVWKGIAAGVSSSDAMVISEPSQSSKKKRKGQQQDEGEAGAVVAPVEQRFEGEIKAHAQCISGVAWDHSTDARAYTASWDHSIKAWDLEKRDCIQTLNGSKVVTCLSLSPLPHHLLATGHPDHRLRIWDLRTPTPAAQSSEASPVATSPGMRKALAPCDAWISGVAWHPTSSLVVASVSHDGMLRLWDLRGNKPLSTTTAHQDQKALAVAFSNDGSRVYTSGSDGVVRSFLTV